MKIVKNSLLILIFTIAYSCGSQRIEYLSNLTIENKKSNDLIKNRVPDYGIDGGDGCVVMNEISMNIFDLKKDFIRGNIFDSESNEPLIFGNINLYIDKGQKIETLNLNSDSNGFLATEFNGKLIKIEVDYIAYRNLKVEL